MKRQSVIAMCLVMLCLIAVTTKTNAQQSDILEVWTINYISPEITKTKLKPLISYFSMKTELKFYVNASNDYAHIAERCVTGKPDILIASTPLLKIITKNCDYEVIALSENPVHLIINTGRVDPKVPVVKSIGLLKNTRGAEIAEELYLPENPTVKVVYYNSFLDLILDDQEQRLDAVIMPYNFFRQAVRFQENWSPYKQYDLAGNTAFMASTKLSTEVKTQIGELLATNNNSIKTLWNKQLGLGTFVSVNKTDLP